MAWVYRPTNKAYFAKFKVLFASLIPKPPQLDQRESLDLNCHKGSQTSTPKDSVDWTYSLPG